MKDYTITETESPQQTTYCDSACLFRVSDSVNALGSSVQIALFVAPLLVLLSLFAAPVPFVLAFSRGEIVLVFMSLLITIFVASGGKTNWYKGGQLLTIYIIFAILFHLMPGK